MAYLKTRPAWIQLMIFISMAFGIFIVISLIGVMILSSLTGINVMEMGDPANWDFNDPSLLGFIRGMLVIQFVGLFLLPSFYNVIIL